jgi:pilus assembly protein CpaB
MKRHARTFIVLAVALVAATISAAMVYHAVRRIPERRVEIVTARAVVAARPLSPGMLLTGDDVKLVPWPAAAPVDGGYSRIDQVVGRGVLSPLTVNEPLTDATVAPVGAGAGLPPSIPAGMRAISIKVNEVIGVAGFVVPGTRVDVVVVVKDENVKAQTIMARAVVSDVPVLAAGTRYDQVKSRDGKPIPSTVVTLMVTPGDAERIALAQNEGRIMLTLRNPFDRAPTETPGVQLAALMGKPAPPPVPRVVHGRRVMVAPTPAPEPHIYKVEAIRASKRTIEVVP